MRPRGLTLSAAIIAGVALAAGSVGGTGAATPPPTTAYLPLVTAPPSQPAVSDWLSYVNALRSLGGLPAVTENATYSDGDYKHSRYMVKNDVIGHDEDTSLPFYTPEGKTAAQNANVMVSSSTATSDESAIDAWLVGPFHGVGVLDPKLRQVGFGAYREEDGGWQMAASLDVLRGRGAIPAGVTFPIKWPAAGKSSWLDSYSGGEYPDPLSPCPGYTTPSGAPIYLMLGSGSVTPSVTASSLTRGGTSLEVCTYTETTYTNADPSAQSLGRAVLAGRDAVIMMPRQPLTPGSYTASVTANGATTTWTFSITSVRPAAAATPDAKADTGEPPAP